MFNSRKNNAIILLIVVVIFGVFLRVTNLSQKPYWLDESYTLLRSSSYTAQEATENLFTGQIIRAEEALRYQQPSFHDKGMMGTVTGLAIEEPQHPPLYFLLTRIWAQHFGDSKLSLRSLPVIGSLLAFPAIYWLCLELFASPFVGGLAMALFAVSPINLRYAQEVRQYSLWTTLILLSCAAILRAIRQPTKLNWGLYSLIISMGIYCHLLMGLIVIAHGIYVLAVERFRLTKTAVAYLVSSCIALVISFPWLWIVWQNRDTVAQTTAYSTRPLPFLLLAQFWSVSLDRLFIAWHFNYNPIFISLTIPIGLLVGYAFYFFCRHTSWQTWSFILIVMGTIFLPFLIPDLVWGGRRSTYERYFLICYISIDIIIAYLIATKLTQPFCRTFQDHFWRWVTVFLLSGGLLSCIAGIFSPTWWGWSEFDVKIAQITNATEQPLIISDVAFSGIAPLFHEVNPDTRLLLLSEPTPLQIPDQFSHVFLYNPSDHLLSTLEKLNRKPELIYQFRDTMTQLTIPLYQLGTGNQNT